MFYINSYYLLSYDFFIHSKFASILNRIGDSKWLKFLLEPTRFDKESKLNSQKS